MSSILRRVFLGIVLVVVVAWGLEACGETPTPTAPPTTQIPAANPTATIRPTATPNQPPGGSKTALPPRVSIPPSSAATDSTVMIASQTVPPVMLTVPATSSATDVTPVALGAAEAPLKATGFDGANAKALLDELTQQVGARVFGQESERKAAAWLENKFRSFGYTQVEQQKFTPAYPGGVNHPEDPSSQNVVAIRPANRANAPILIFGGHYDTVANTVGASDNGSGTVITLEIARVLLQKYPDYELRFVAFGAEEVGLFGSQYYATQLTAAEKQRTKAFINLDALGVGEKFIAVGTPELVTLAINTARSNGVRLENFDLSKTPNSSDHVSFINNGVKSVGLLRWIDPQLHKPGDSAKRVYPETLLQAGGTALLLTEQLLKE